MYVISGDTWLNYLGGIAVFIISDIHFAMLAAEDTTGCRLGMVFFT